jgi:hypothetical protein
MSASKRESAISAVRITILVAKITGAVTAVIAVAVAHTIKIKRSAITALVVIQQYTK